MHNYPAVSIFIVTYMNSEDRGEILLKTCEAALNQNYPELEVVISDNGGSYSAKDALASVLDPRLKIHVATENAGFTGNVNRCLDLCRHDLIKLLCDDDLIHPDFLKVTVPYVNDETLVVGGVEKYIIGKTPVAMNEPLPDRIAHQTRRAGYDGDIWDLPYAASSIPSANIFTRKFFSSLGKYDDKTVTSDWDFFIEACIHRNVVYLDQTLCYVGVWAGSLTEEMLEKPYFYPEQGLYTKFRVLKSKNLLSMDQKSLKSMLVKELIKQGLRLPRHFFQKKYHVGFSEFRARFFSLNKYVGGDFTTRPSNL